MPTKLTLPDTSVPLGVVKDGRLVIDPAWYRALKAIVDKINSGT
jgi:hypothetical protein